MKRFTLVAALAMVFALVPAMTAGYAQNRQAGVSAQDTNAHIHLMNLINDVSPAQTGFVAQPVDVVLDGSTLISNFAKVGGFDFTLPVSTTHTLKICQAGTAPSCSTQYGANQAITGFPQGQFDAALVGGPPASGAGQPFLFIFNTVNNTTSTALGNARFTVHSALGPPTPAQDICLNGTKLFSNLGFGQSQEAEVPAVTNASLDLVNSPAACPAPGSNKINLAAGNNFVLTLGGTATFGNPFTGTNITSITKCTTGCAEVFFVGQGRPTNSASNPAFCAALNPGLLSIQAEIKSVLGGITVGNSSTFPSTAAVQTLVTDINNAVAAGDTTVPATIQPQWEQATSGLRQLAAGLTAAGFDVSKIPSASLQKIVDGANGVNQAPNASLDAAKTVLTNFFVTSCIAAAAPKFTG